MGERDLSKFEEELVHEGMKQALQVDDHKERLRRDYKAWR